MTCWRINALLVARSRPRFRTNKGGSWWYWYGSEYKAQAYYLKLLAAHEPTTVRMGPNETVQQAIDRSGPGDTIEIPYGIYNESVFLDWSDVTLAGIPNEAGDVKYVDQDSTNTLSFSIRRGNSTQDRAGIKNGL